MQINGKTSGSTKYTTADATAQAVTVFTAAQTTGAATLTIPDQAGTSRNFVFDTSTQTLSNKTFTAPGAGHAGEWNVDELYRSAGVDGSYGSRLIGCHGDGIKFEWYRARWSARLVRRSLRGRL